MMQLLHVMSEHASNVPLPLLQHDVELSPACCLQWLLLSSQVLEFGMVPCNASYLCIAL